MDEITTPLMMVLAALIGIVTIAHKIIEYKLARIRLLKETQIQSEIIAISTPIQRNSSRNKFMLLFELFIYVASVVFLVYFAFPFRESHPATLQDVALVGLIVSLMLQTSVAKH